MRIRRSEMRICLVMGRPPGFTPARFPKWAEPEVFRFVLIGNPAGTRFYQESARAKRKAAILQRMCSAYWVLSQLPLCSRYYRPEVTRTRPPKMKVGDFVAVILNRLS